MKRKNLFLTAVAALALLCAAVCAACSDGVTLSFETNGGVSVPAITAKAGDEVTLPATSKSGFAFAGWYASADFSGDPLGSTVTAPEKSATYYAKWETGYEVRLELDGGVIGGDTSLWLAAGANVYNAVKEIVPVKSGLSFGAWFLDGSELGSSYRMPAETVTLTAKYKVGYIMQVYLQNLDRTSYQRRDALETEGKGYVNTEVSPEAPTVPDYSLQPAPEGANPVSTLLLSEDAERNVYSFYYDRNEYVVYYDGNAPAGVTLTGATPYQTVVFGGSAKVQENGFAAEGYRFAGWALSPDGEVAYLPGSAEKGTVRVDAPVNLYALWDRGYTDRFGSDDLVFFPRTEPDRAVLRRGGVEFYGTRTGNAFLFTTPSGIVLRGTALGGSFSYEREDLAGKYILYDNYPHPTDEDFDTEDRYTESCTLVVDAQLNAVYTKDGVAKNGTLTFEPDSGDYFFTPDDGSEGFHTVMQKSEDRNVFSIGGSEFGYYVAGGQILILDGYGAAFLELYMEGQFVPIEGLYYIEGDGMASGYNASSGSATYYSYKIVCWLNDANGYLSGGAGYKVFYLCMIPNVDTVEGQSYGSCFFADTSRGTYENGMETLVLDGHGYYEDSAVYTDGEGHTFQGHYTVSADFVSGSVAEIRGENGEVRRFRLSSDGSFSAFTDPEVAYHEYYLFSGDSISPVLLVLFEEEHDGVRGSKRAEMYANNSRGVGTHAGSGYVTFAPVQDGSSVLLYTFHRTSVDHGFQDVVPEEMKFILTTVYTNNNMDYGAYVVFEQDGVKNYKVIDVPNGTVWANETVTVEGEGSLYFVGSDVIPCGFLIEHDEYFGDDYGEITYLPTPGVETGESELFLLKSGGDGGADYTATPAAGIPVSYYFFDPQYGIENGLFIDLVLGADGRAAFNETGTGEEWTIGTYRPAQSGPSVTTFGAPVYELVLGGTVRFTFVLGTLNVMGNVLEQSYFRNVGKEGAYSAEDGGTLLLDGFGAARYTKGGEAVSGSYYFAEENVVRVTAADGTHCEFELTGGSSFLALDSAYGEWNLVDGNFFPLNDHSVISFDGKGTYIITDNYGSGSSAQGRYALHDAAYDEYVLYLATINGQRSNYYVRFMDMQEYGNMNCVVCSKAAGVYTDDDYNVLSVNGYGSGVFKGDVYDSHCNFYTIDAEEGFFYLMFTDQYTGYEGLILHVLLDYEEGTFRILENTDYYGNFLYIASDFDTIAFRDDGAGFIGNLINGDYLVTEDGVTLYEERNGAWIVHELPAYGSDVGSLVYEGKTYYRFDGTVFTAEGSVKMLDANQAPQVKTPEVKATMHLPIRPRSIINFEVSFEIGGNEYEGFLFSTYTQGKIAPRIEYNDFVYDIDFTRGDDGKWTFTVKDGGVRTFTRNDLSEMYYNGTAASGAEYHQGGKLVSTFNGFGSYELEETVYSGNFLYLYDKAKPDGNEIVFRDIPASEIRTVGRYNLGSSFGGYHDLREIVFTHGNKQYAIDFFEYERSGSATTADRYVYILQGFYEYGEAAADGGYALGVKYLLHANLSGSPGYGDDTAVGKPVAVTLLHDGKPVVALMSGSRYGDKGAWLVENDGGSVGAAYLIGFVYGTEESAGKVVSATVQKGSLQTVGLTASYNFYLFVDEDGEIGDVMMARYGETPFVSVTELSHQGNVWTFLGREIESEPLRRYTLTFVQGSSGNYTVHVEPVVIEE